MLRGSCHRTEMRLRFESPSWDWPGAVQTAVCGQADFANEDTYLDRYAARCANFVLAVTRIAVLGARSAPKKTLAAKGSAGIKGWSPLAGSSLKQRHGRNHLPPALASMSYAPAGRPSPP
jgi:hypothetical protein